MMREVYSTLFLVLCIYHVEGESAVLGQHFLHIIKRQEFFSQGNTAAIEFQAKSKSYPDLPSWLTLKQRTELQDAYLFGTPRAEAVSTDIQIIALNKGTYQTEQDAFSITVDTTKDLPKNIVELRVKNYNIEEFLAGQALSNLTRIMAKLWPEAGTLQVVKVSSLVDELGRVPVPDGPMQPLPKEGVLVQIGGAGDFSALLASVSQQVNNTNCMNQEQFIGIREDFEPEFNLDWCAFKMFPLDPLLYRTETPNIPVVHPDGNFQILTESPAPRQDLTVPFILIIVLPCVIGILLCLVLSYIMFGRRQGVRKRNAGTTDHQLQQFVSIKKATSNLRQMSHKRQESMPGTPVSSSHFRPQGQSTPVGNTPGYTPPSLRSGHEGSTVAPPPYRLPPVYPPHDASLSPSPVTPTGGERTGDQEQLVSS